MKPFEDPEVRSGCVVVALVTLGILAVGALALGLLLAGSGGGYRP